MSTMKGILRRAVLTGIAGAAGAASLVGVARADVASDKPGAILIFPKIIVDSSGVLNNGVAIDTELQLVNSSNSIIGARCFIVNTTSHCSSDDQIACRADLETTAARRCPIGDTCDVGWVENDFDLILTKRQPISWRASLGTTLPCDGITRTCPANNTLPGAGPAQVPPASSDPFYGEIKCVEADPATLNPSRGLNPANAGDGDLFGNATIVRRGSADRIDASKYNAIAIGAVGAQDSDPNTLTLGPGNSGEYSGCPNSLLMDHLFDGATVRTHYTGGTPQLSGGVTTDLTVIPCSQDFNEPSNLGGATLQFLVYNEFEQRFSTSTNFSCWREVQLSDIDTRPGPTGNQQSIFSAAVQGTLAGQTRIRPVADSTGANGILAISEEFWDSSVGPDGTSTTAANVHFVGVNETKGDVITLPEH